MSTVDDFETLIQRDADEILTEARLFDGRQRFRLMRVAAESYPGAVSGVERLKIVWVFQALLATTENRRLPIPTGLEVAERLAGITRSRDETLQVRRAALDSLALVFLKTKTLTDQINRIIRDAFTSAFKSNDRYMSEFAAEALSGEGLLASRKPLRDESILRAFRRKLGRKEIAALAERLSDFVTPVTRGNPLGAITGKKSSAKKQAPKRSAGTPAGTAKHL